jgi:high-affinity Fe2+/Pb2+ permease
METVLLLLALSMLLAWCTWALASVREDASEAMEAIPDKD